MRIKASLWLYGIVTALLWSVSFVQSVFLTSTLITGMMGGYLIGRMPLGTFLGALTNNASLPTLPSVTSFLPSFPTFSPRKESEQNKTTETITPKQAVTTTTTTAAPSYSYSPPAYPMYPTYPNYLYPPVLPLTTPPPTPSFNFPLPYSYSGNGLFTYNMFTSTTTTKAPPAAQDDFGFSYIKPVDVPVSLDNKIRERFIRQLAMIDPLNCLPKTFCEVTSDPYRATMALDKGSILGMASITQPRITKEELMAYEAQLPTERPPPRPSTTTQAPTTTSAAPEKDLNEEGEENDDGEHGEDDEPEDDADSGASNEEHEEEDGPEDDTDSGSHSNENSDEDDDSFERYRKEHEHKIEMEALNELVDEIEDPDEYMFILRDKQRRKDARKKYRQNHSSINNGRFRGGHEPAAFRGDALANEEMHPGFYEEPSMGLSRRAGSEPDYYYPPPMPPLPPQPPPVPLVPPQPSFTSFFRRSRTTTEPPMKDMFADDPFFNDDNSGRIARKLKDFMKRIKRRRNQRDLIGDPLTQYRLAYIVAEKYKNPNLCNAAFPSCPYQTQTIMSVVNRLESGVLPFGKGQVNRYREKQNRNNLDQFRNTLVAIERLNKATMNARSRGEPIDIDEMTEVASDPTSEIDSHTSQDIVNEFQKVVRKIQMAQFSKRKLQLEKAKPLNSDQPKTSYDAVHYYKKAQMEDLRPKEKLKTGILETKTNVRQQDDEAPHKIEVPTFKETYREMFQKGVKSKAKAKSKSTTPAPNKNRTPNKFQSKKGSSRKSERRKAKPKPTVQNVSSSSSQQSSGEGEGEDDERDAKNEQIAVDAMIMGRRRQRSRYTLNKRS